MRVDWDGLGAVDAIQGGWVGWWGTAPTVAEDGFHV